MLIELLLIEPDNPTNFLAAGSPIPVVAISNTFWSGLISASSTSLSLFVQQLQVFATILSNLEPHYPSFGVEIP